MTQSQKRLLMRALRKSVLNHVVPSILGAQENGRGEWLLEVNNTKQPLAAHVLAVPTDETDRLTLSIQDLSEAGDHFTVELHVKEFFIFNSTTPDTILITIKEVTQ